MDDQPDEQLDEQPDEQLTNQDGPATESPPTVPEVPPVTSLLRLVEKWRDRYTHPPYTAWRACDNVAISLSMAEKLDPPFDSEPLLPFIDRLQEDPGFEVLLEIMAEMAPLLPDPEVA